MFLPPNTKSLIRLMDQGATSIFKPDYTANLMKCRTHSIRVDADVEMTNIIIQQSSRHGKTITFSTGFKASSDLGMLYIKVFSWIL